MDRTAVLQRLTKTSSRYRLSGMQLPLSCREVVASDEAFIDHLKGRAAWIDRIPALVAGEGILPDGALLHGGGGLRFTDDAFADFCAVSHTPGPFIRRLAEENEILAQEVIRHQYCNHFRSARMLVVDREAGLILGATGETTYQPLSHVDLVEWALSALPGSDLRRGWARGGHMRAVICRTDAPLCLEPGDSITTGVEVRNCLHGDGAVVITGYLERTACKNGLRLTHMESRIPHRGEGMHDEVCARLVAVAEAALGMQPILTKAFQTPVASPAAASDFLSNPKNGGSQELAKGAWDLASDYASGSDHKAIHVMDLANGVSELAHGAPSVERRVQIESLAYLTITRFLDLEAQ